MGHRRNVISPPFWRNNIRGNGNGRGNGKGKRSDQGHRFYFESLEPRILLSGDLSTIGVSEAIYEGIGKFGVVVNDFILQEPLLDVQLPIVVSSSGDNLLNYETIAPTIEELLRVNADADGDGSGESGLYDPDLDRNNDLVLDFSDLFLTKFIDEIRGYLNDPQDLDVDGDIDSDDFLAFLIDPARNEAGSFSSEEYADRSWSLNVDAAQNISSDHEVAFQLDLTLVFTNEMALDLGYQAEDLGIVPEATLDVEAAVSFTLQFGVMTSGEEATDSDFFVSIPEPMSIEVTLQDSSLDGEVNIGFLGADFNNGSVTLEANIDATFTDPTNLDSRISYSDLSDYPVSSLIEAEPRGVTFDGSDPAIVKDSVSPYTKNLVITISDNILQVGDLVVYSNGGGESIGNLIDGSIYSVMRVEGDSASSEIQLMNTGESSTQVKFESAGTGSNHRLILSRFDIDLPVEVKEGLAGFEPSDAISFKTPTHNPFEASTAIVEEDGNMEDLFQVRERDKRFNFGIDLEQDLLNFTNMDASSIIGLFREFGRYLDGLGDSGDFTSFGIPFAMADLGDVMDFRDMWDDGVLYDDGDDGIDGPDKLVVDFNAALANGVLTSDTEKSVDLTGRIIATADGTNITLAAIDPDIQSFDVSVTSGAADLGLATGSNPSSGGSFPFLTFVPNDVTLSGGKAEFSITIVTGAGIEEAVTVDILPDDTSDNTGVGNDSAGIIDAGNAPLFATAQELAEQLARVLYPTQDNPIQTREEQLAHINAAYNTGTADLTYNINLENTLPFLEAQTDFNLLLEPLDNISSDSKVLLGGSAGLDMVLGINLLDSISSDYLQDTTTLEEIEVEIKSEPAVTGENNVRTIYGRLTEDATFDVIIDADTYEVTVHVADAGLLGFDNGQEADGTITAARDASDFSPGSDITFELTVGTDDPYIIKLPTTGISGTDDNLNLDDLVADLNAALSGALAADGMTIDLRADVEAGTDPSGTKLTLAHLGDSNTSLGIKSLGAMSDNERTTMADGVLDLVKDIELALTNARLIGTNDTDPRSRVDLTNIITVTNEEGRLKLSSESDFTVTVDSGDPAMNKLGFRSEHQAEPDDPDNPAPPYSLTSTKDAPRLVGRLTDDAIFTIEFGGVEYTVTVEAGDAEANQTVLDLVNDLNFALSNPSMVSDTVSDFTLDSAATFQVSINGGSFVDVIVQPEATNATSAPIPFNGDTDVDPDDDTITLTGHNLETGESLIYRNNGGNNIAGLNDGETYYVFVVDSDTVRLAVGEMEALSGETVDLLDSDSAGDHQLEETLNVDIEDLVQDINRAIAATDVDGIRLDKYIVAESYVWGEESRIRIKALNNHDDPVLGFELTVEPDDPAETFLGLPNSQLCGNLEGLIEAGSQGNHLVLTSLNGSGFTIDAASAAELGLSTSQTSDSDDLVIHLSDGNDYRVDLDGAVTVADVMVAITEQTSLENLSEAELGFDPTQDAAAAGSDLVIAAVNPETVDASSGLSGDAFFTLSVTRGESNEVAEVVVPKGSGTGGTLVSDITEALEKAGFEGGFTIGRDSSGHITLTAADATITAFSLMSLGPVKVQINDEKKGTGLKLIDRTWFESDSDILFFVEPTNSSPAATQLGITRIDVTRDGNEDGDVNNLDADGVIDGAPIKGPDLADRFFVENAEVRGEFLLMTPQTDDDGIFRDTDNDDDLWDGIDASAALGYLGVSLHGGGMLSGEVQSTLDNAGTKGIDAITNTRPTVTGTAADGTFGQLILDVTATPPLSIENMDHPDDSRIALTVTSMGDPFDEHVLPDPVKSGADTIELKGDHTDLLVKGAAVTIGLDESSTFTDTIDGLDQKAADSFTLDGDQTGLISSGSKVLFDNNATRVKGAIYDDIEKTTTVTIVDAVLPAVLSEVTVWRSLLAEVLGSSYDPDEDTTTVTFRTDAIAGVAIGTLDADAHFTIETGGIEYNVTVEAWQTAENSTVLDLVDDINQALAQPSLVSDPLAGFVLSGPADFSVSVNGGSPVSVVIMPEHTDGTGAPVNFNGDTDVDPESDTIAIGSNGFVTGEKVIYSSNNGTVIHGLEEGQIYFVIVEDANSIKLASTRRNALYESAVDIIAGGSVGEHRLTEAPNDGDDIEDLVLDINAAIRGTDLDGLIVAESYVQGEDSRIRIKAIDDAVDRFRLEAVPGNALSLPESHITGNLESKIEAHSQGDRLVLTSKGGEVFAVTAPADNELGFGPLQTSDNNGGIVTVTAEKELARSLVEVAAATPPVISVTTPGLSDVSGLGDLLYFDDIDFDDVVNALSELSSFLEEFEAFGDLADSLLLFDQSVTDLMGLADQFDDAVDKAENNPARTLQALEGKLEEAFGLPDLNRTYTDVGDGLVQRSDNSFTLAGDQRGQIGQEDRIVFNLDDVRIDDTHVVDVDYTENTYSDSDGLTREAVGSFALDQDRSVEIIIGAKVKFGDYEALVTAVEYDAGSDTTTVTISGDDLPDSLAEVTVSFTTVTVLDPDLPSDLSSVKLQKAFGADDGLSVNGSGPLQDQPTDYFTLAGDRTGEIVLGAKVLFEDNDTRVTDVASTNNTFYGSDGLDQTGDDTFTLTGDRTDEIIRGAKVVFGNNNQGLVTDVDYVDGTDTTTVILNSNVVPNDLTTVTISYTTVNVFGAVLPAGLSGLTVSNDFIDLSLDRDSDLERPTLRFNIGLATQVSDLLDAALLDINLLELISDVNLADLGRRGEVQFDHDRHGLTVDLSGGSFILDGDQGTLVGPGSKVLFDSGEVRVTGVTHGSFTYDGSGGLSRLDGQRFSVDGDQTGEIVPGSKAMFDGGETRVADSQYDAVTDTTTVTLDDPVLPDPLTEITLSYTTVTVADNVLPDDLAELTVSFMITATDHGLAWDSGTAFTLSGDQRGLIAEGYLISFEDGAGNRETRVLSVDYDIGTDITTVTVSDDADLPATLSEVAISDEFADLRASGILPAEGGMVLNLDFGIDLGDPDVEDDAGDVYLYGDTVIEGGLSTPFNGIDHMVRDLDFRANLGPFSLDISDGSASAVVDFGAETGFAGRKLVGDVDLTEGTPDVTSSLDQTSKAEFPAKFNSIDIGTFSFSSNPGLTLPGGFRTDFVEDYTDEKTNLFDNILLAVDGVDLFLSGLQDLLDGEVFGFRLPLIGDQLADGARFIEDLREDFVDPFRGAIETADEVVTDFEDPDKNIISGFLFDLLGPGGVNLLQLEEGGDPQAVGDYIALDSDFSSITDSFIQWNMTIGGTLFNPSAGIGFDIGLPGLNLETEGSIELKICWELAFGFGISFTDGFYLDISDGDELELNVEVTLPDAAITGTLAFLRLRAEDKDVDGDGDSTHLAAKFGINIINQADKELIAHQDELPPGEKIEDYLDQKLTLPELFGQLSLDFVLGFEAAVELGLVLEVSGDLIGEDTAAGFPSISADFIADFALEKSLIELLGKDKDEKDDKEKKDKTDPFVKAIMDGLNLVEFQHVALDLGSYVSDVLGPVVDKIQDITEPIQPVIDILTEPIPVISDLGPDLTLLDIAAMAGRVDKRLLYAIADVITLINSIPDPSSAESLMLDFGNYTIYDKNSGIVQAALWSEKYDLAEGTDKLLNDPLAVTKLFTDFDSAMNNDTPKGSGKKTKGVLNKMRSAGDFAFPIFDDPAQVFGLLTGRPAVLITYDMDPLVFEFEWSQFFSIYGPLGVSINMEFSATIDFAFGYDTLGIQEFVESGFRDPLLLLDGFYVSDTNLATGDFGTDVPELVFSGGLYAAAELNLGIARAGVAGGIFAQVEFDLYDPDRDGRVRIKELIGNFENEWNYGSPALAPLAIFDVHGEVWAKLFAFLEIDFVIFSFSIDFDITPPLTLVEFDIPFTRPPNLATETGGDLVINAGENASERLNYNTVDGSEVFTLWGDGNSLDVNVSAFGFTQEYQLGGSTIYISGGEGNDVFNLSELKNPDITVVIDGGPGDDVIFAGAGTAIIRGDEGDDIIYGGSGDNEIYGGLGDDTIYAGGGNDLVFGDEGFKSRTSARAFSGPTDGDDRIFGQGGNDILIGGGGVDHIDGGDNEDILIGDGGQITFNVPAPFDNEEVPERGQVDEIKYTVRDFYFAGDVLLGGSGGDEIYGGRGDDIIDGGPDGDIILGEDGFDIIHGGSGGDTIFGDNWRVTEEGFETTYGGQADKIFGDEGQDTIYGGGGGDLIHGGNEDLVLDGDDGDTIYGGTGADEIYGDSGNDTIYGEGDPDRIFGGEGDDPRLDGGDGDDMVRGGTGEDRLFAGLGSDLLFGEQGSDRYILNLRGADNSSITEVFDSGTSTRDTDGMFVNGTDFDDQFLLRAGYGKAFVALLNDFPNEGVYDNVERINYDGLERLVVNGLAGQDRFAVDDVAAEATINGGIGEDFFQVGQLYRSPRAENPEANIAEGDEFGTIETTRGWLSSGITLPMTINGGAEDDEFIVFHNLAVLTLNGGTGDDLFTIRAFALVGSQDTPRERTDIHGGGGADLIQYAVNAPVNIDGGDGLDTIIVIGTEFADDFVITEKGVYGAGLNVNFVGIEILRVDGAEGDDRFFVLSTGENFITEIFGGLGSDTFNMAGDTPPVVSNDLLGHSGVVTHSVESVGSEYDGIKVNGISANVADNDEPAIRITQTGDSTIVSEDGLTDTYRVVLARQPDEDVYVKALAPARTPEEEAMEAFHFSVSSGTGTNETDGSATTLLFTRDNWYLPQTVMVSAPDTVIVDQKAVTGATSNTLKAAEGTFKGLNLSGMRVRVTFSDGSSETRETRIIESNTDSELILTRQWDTVPNPEGDFLPTFDVVKPFDDEALEGVTFGAVNHIVISRKTVIGGEEDGGPKDVFLTGTNTLTAGTRILDNVEVVSASSTRLTAETGAFDGLDLTGARVWITSGAGAGQVKDVDSVDGSTLTVSEGWDPGDLPDQGSVLAILITDITVAGGEVLSTDPAGLTAAPGAFEGMDLSGARVWITEGPGAGQIRDIASVDGNTLTLTSDWDSGEMPDTRSRFAVLKQPSFLNEELDGAVVRITEGPGRGQTRLIDHINSTADTIFLFNDWNAGSTPGVGSRFVVVRDDGIRSLVSQNVSDTFEDFRARYPIAVGGLVGATLTVTDSTGAQDSKIITANTVDTITVGLDTPWAVVFEEGSEYLVTRDGQVVTVNDLPVEGTVTSIVTRTFTVTGANFDPTVITDGAVEKNGLRAATIEIVGGTGIGQMRVIESSTDDSITVTTPWRTELDDTSEFVINRYHGLALPSVTVRVEDNDAAGVVITQTADSTDVMENSLAAGTVTEAADAGSTILTDSTAGFTPDELTGYVLVTGGSGAGQIRAIDSNTSDTITVVSPWSEALDDTSGYRVVRDLAPWTDTYSAVLARMPEFPVEVTIDLLDSQILVTSDDPRFDTDSDGKPVLTFNATNWDAPVILTVLAADDSDPEGFHHGYIAHTVLSADVDVPRESTDSFPALADEPQTSVMLMHDPSSESITVKVDGMVRDADRYELSSSTVIFLDEDGAPEEVKGEVSVTYSYLVPGYDGVEVDRVVANVGDDDAPGVLITESDGSTDLIEITDRQGLITGTVQPGADRLVFGDFGEQDLVGRIIQITDGEGVGQSRIIEVNSASEALVDEAWDVPPDGTSTFEIVEVEALTGSIDTAGNWLFISDPNPYFRISGVADLTALIGMTVEITGGAGKGQTREITQIKDYPLLGGQYIIVDSDWDVVPEAGSPYRIVTDEQILLSGAVDHGLETVLVGSFDYDDLEGETITITTSADEVHTNTVVSRSSINGLEFLILEDEWSLDGIHEADSEYEITITLEGVPWDDSYTVTLTKEAVGEVWVTVKPEITKTTREKIRYDNIQVIVEADPLTSPDAQSGTVVERFDGVDITIPFIKLRFDSTNWNIPQTVNVKAIDDPVADGGDTKVFAPRLHTVNDIMGPLFLQGAGGQGSLVGLTPPVLLPENPFDPDSLAETNLKQATGEIAVPVTGDGMELVVHTADIADYDSLIDRTVEITQVSERGPEAAVDQFRLILKAVDNGDGTTTLTLNDPWDVDPGQLKYLAKYAITNQSLNFFVDEDVQVDFLTVYHDDSVANNTGSLMEANEADRIRGYDQRIAGMGMGPDIQIGGELRPGGITFGTMEIAVINLGSGKDTFNVQSTHNRDDFTTWTMLNTGAGDDTVNVSLEADEQLTVGVAEAATGNTLTSRDPATLPGGESPAGYAVLITSGPGAGQMRAITAYDFATDIMTVNRDWTVLPEGDSQFAIVNRGDGAFTLDTQEGNDTVLASGSTLPLIIFGGDGSDTITGGQGDDVIFGDRGRVDYLDESGDNIRVVTRLGSAPENLTGSVTDAGNNSLVVELDEYLSIDALPTEDEGLRGLVVWINEGKGAGQSRLIVSNTGNVITVDTDWSVVPDATSGFRITGFPSDQTDEMIREASFLFSSDPGVGGDDIIWGGMGEDVLIGGAGGDAVDGGSDADLLFGDNVKLDRTEGRVDDYTYPRFRALSGSVIYDAGDQDQVDDSVDYTDPAGIPAWANWDIVMNEPTRFDSYGGDYIAGGSGSDMIFGQLGDDTIQGDGAIETGTSVPVPPSIYIPGHTDADPLPLVFNLFEAVTDGDDYIEGNGGADTIYGGLGQDDLIGGSSDLFSLVTPELRPDGSDIIFGGNGTRVDRNDLVTETNRGNIVSGDEHSRDADMILGDNGNIFRLVDPATGQLLAFNYDSYGSERIIPRAARLLDYSPGGPDYLPNAGTIDSDIGAADEVHGESGDDFIYGTAGDDALYGDAGDDDLIGGYGNDWISGGTGQDGILGDDGRIWTSRNGLAEPLNGIEAIPASELDLYIATGGDIQNSVINITGQLKKTANLTPFKLGDPDEPQYTPTYDPLYADDIIYGGWGSDFIHGGDGDDAVSGAEALPEFYAAPVNPGDVLGYDPVTGEFAAYDENDPWHKVEGFLLNFDPREGLPDTTFDPAGTTSDGDDVIFGDLGHDWIVGGTGRDHLYGGRGDDLLNADDDHDSGGVTNREPDADPTYEDIAYGGAGRDRLLANTGGDRLIDWAGEFNSYIVPFSPFGIGTVSRQLQPAVMEYLYQLSASDGADPTRAADEGSDPDRNGEPYGELGLVKQQDPDWQDQTGGPDDPQPGNDGGSRDVLRTAAPEDPTAAGTVSDPSSGFETLIFDETTGTFYDPNLMTGTAPVAAVTTDPSLTPEAEDWIVEV